MARITGLAIGNDRIKLEDADSINNKINTEAQVRETADKTLQANIGDVTKLHTATQNSVVEAINEVLATRVEANPVGVMLVNYLYPVGSIYLSLDATFNPNMAWQGTKWELIEAGRYLRATQTEADVGRNVEEALPNIKGGANAATYVTQPYNGYGAIQSTYAVAPSFSGTSGNWGANANWNFNASRSSSVYQDGAKVTPNSIDIYMWKRVEL